MTADLERAGRQTVGLCLMKSGEGEAAVAYLADHFPALRIQDRGTFYLVEGEGEIRVEMDGIGEYLGREIPVRAFLVTMASYYGRAQVEDHAFIVTSEMLQLEGRDEHP